MCEVGFFEGPEKLMEVWWKPLVGIGPSLTNGEQRTPESRPSGDLRTIPREKWEKVLELVNCQIISERRNEDMIAYLLSESSMFISKERLILKTCGQTTLLYSIKPLFKLAEEECGLTEVMDFFYSRMNYQEPSLQQEPHKSFEQEAKWLDNLFSDGAAYAMGRVNRDTWYLYTLHNTCPGVDIPDQTLEILMQDLDPTLMKAFYKKEYADVKEVTQVTGIGDFVPGALIDDAMFDPCGYSMNGLVGDNYFTIHITPQEECSYVSFETNLKLKSYSELVNKVLKTFQPGRFLMTLFANEGAPCGLSMTSFQESCFIGYKRNDLQLCQMKKYNLTYGHYEKLKGLSDGTENGP